MSDAESPRQVTTHEDLMALAESYALASFSGSIEQQDAARAKLATALREADAVTEVHCTAMAREIEKLQGSLALANQSNARLAESERSLEAQLAPPAAGREAV